MNNEARNALNFLKRHFNLEEKKTVLCVQNDEVKEFYSEKGIVKVPSTCIGRIKSNWAIISSGFISLLLVISIVSITLAACCYRKLNTQNDTIEVMNSTIDKLMLMISDLNSTIISLNKTNQGSSNITCCASVKGQEGNKCPEGNKGPDGIQGPPGIRGPDGIQGPPGSA